MKKSIWKRVLSVCLMFTLAFMLPAVPLQQSKAASNKTQYIAGFKL